MSTLITSSLLIMFCYVVFGLAKFRQYAINKGLVDIPNHRSSHTQIKPRAGGLVFMGVWLQWMVFGTLTNIISTQLFLLIVPSVLILSLVGFIDDRYTIAARWRFLAQLLAAIIFLAQLGIPAAFHLGTIHLSFGIVGAILSAIALIWSTNLFNFMDGTDGIAGIEAITIFLFGGLILLTHGAVPLALICFSICFAVAGFLVWNWPPAKIFMGDIGSTSLGFLVIAIALMAQQFHDISIVPWLILYSVFLFDASVTLARRIMRGEKWYQAHRSHAYQRLHQAGFSHRDVLFTVTAVNLSLVVCALIAAHSPHLEWLMLIAALTIVSVYYYWVERLQKLTQTSYR